MSFGDQAVPEEEPVSSEGEAVAGEVNGSAAPAPEHAGPAEEADPREVLARERDEYLLALQRTQADFENYRKRITRQQEEQAARASQHLVDKLLPVLDALDLAENHLQASLDVGEGAKALPGAIYGVLLILVMAALPTGAAGAARAAARALTSSRQPKVEKGGVNVAANYEGKGEAP